jgi:hypothetical protein
MKISELRPQHLDCFLGKLCYIGFLIGPESLSFTLKNGKVIEIDTEKTNIVGDFIDWDVEDTADKIEGKLNSTDSGLEIRGIIFRDASQITPFFIVYEIFDVEKNEYWPTSSVISFCLLRKIEPFPIYWMGEFNLTLDQVADLVKTAQLKENVLAHGVVIGTVAETESDFLDGNRARLELTKD